MLCRLPMYYSIAADVSYMYESSHYYGKMLYGSVWELSAGAWDNRVVQVSVSYRFGRGVAWTEEEKSSDASQDGQRR
jgi:hypothetical protein